MKNYYDEIHRLLRNKQLDMVLSMLCTKNGDKIKSPYNSDLNHAWYIVGDIHYKNSNYELAISAFKKSIHYRDGDDEAYFALANSYSEMGLPHKAECSLRKAIKIKRKDVYIYNLANSLFDQEKYEGAVRLYSDVTNEDHELYCMAQKNLRLAKNKMDME